MEKKPKRKKMKIVIILLATLIFIILAGCIFSTRNDRFEYTHLREKEDLHFGPEPEDRFDTGSFFLYD